MSSVTRSALKALRPLDDDEADRARQAARAALTRQVGETDAVVHSVGLRVDKPQRGRTPARSVGVIVFDRRGGLVWEVVVDESGGVSVHDRPGYQPPFLPEEVAEARRVAAAAVDVGGEEDDSIGVLPFFPGSADGRRLVGLNYVGTTAEGVVGLATVVVDLTGGRVDRYERRG